MEKEGRRRGSLKQFALRAEAAFWITRPVSITTAFIAIPGWLAAESSTSTTRLVAMVAATMASRMAANVVNDLFDKDKDRVTAPWLPLPSGLLTVRQAMLVVGVLVGCMLVLLFVAAANSSRFFLGVSGVIVGALVYSAYSFVKSYPVIAMAVTGFGYMCPPTIAWIVAGGGWSIELVVVLCYALVCGIAANVFSNIRDVDRDADVGNYSVAVRLGVERALLLSLTLEVVACLCIFGIAILRHRLIFGVVTGTVSIGLLTLAYLKSAKKLQLASSRTERMMLMGPIYLARNYVGLILMQSVPIGCAVGLVHVVVRRAPIALYARRIQGGELRRALSERLDADNELGEVIRSPTTVGDPG